MATKDKTGRKRGLTPKQQRFVEEYLVDLCATQAAIRAGYSAKTAYSAGQRLLKHVEVQAAIRKAAEERSKRTEITADRVLEEYARIGLGDIRHVVGWEADKVTLKPSEELTDDVAAAIGEVQQTSNGDLKVKLHSKVAALDAMAKHLGLFVNRHEVKHSGEVGPRDVRITLVKPDGTEETETRKDGEGE